VDATVESDLTASAPGNGPRQRLTSRRVALILLVAVPPLVTAGVDRGAFAHAPFWLAEVAAVALAVLV